MIRKKVPPTGYAIVPNWTVADCTSLTIGWHVHKKRWLNITEPAMFPGEPSRLLTPVELSLGWRGFFSAGGIIANPVGGHA